jgi:hypothetical protein
VTDVMAINLSRCVPYLVRHHRCVCVSVCPLRILNQLKEFLQTRHEVHATRGHYTLQHPNNRNSVAYVRTFEVGTTALSHGIVLNFYAVRGLLKLCNIC